MDADFQDIWWNLMWLWCVGLLGYPDSEQKKTRRMRVRMDQWGAGLGRTSAFGILIFTRFVKLHSIISSALFHLLPYPRWCCKPVAMTPFGWVPVQMTKPFLGGRMVSWVLPEKKSWLSSNPWYSFKYIYLRSLEFTFLLALNLSIYDYLILHNRSQISVSIVSYISAAGIPGKDQVL